MDLIPFVQYKIIHNNNNYNYKKALCLRTISTSEMNNEL